MNLKNRINQFRIQFPFIIVSCFAFSCAYTPYYSKEVRHWKKTSVEDSIKVIYSTYLIGDAGGPALNHQEPSLKLLESFLVKDTNSSVVYLGDNIYFDGMPPTDALHRDVAEKKIKEQMDILQNYKGEVYFIAGNHDWDYMRQDGLAHVRFEEQFVEEYLNRGNTFIPDNGCPGPYFIPLNSNVVLIALDSQWWLHKYEKPYGRCSDCTAEDEEDMLIQLEDYIKTNRNKHIIIAAHHPLVSNGNHGGYYSAMDYFFPLRTIRPNWYVPLPGIGSIYPLFRKFGGVDQDIAHYRYQQYKNEIEKIIVKYDNIIYAAGHDHNLQLHQTDSINHIISGSGSKLNPVKGGDHALYTHKHKGFAVIKYYNNGDAWVEFWIPKGDGEEGELTFKYKLYTRKSGHPQSYCSLSAIDYSDSTATKKATEKYEAKKIRRIFLGNHYREEWITPVDVPVLDMKTDEGGLIPYGIGGRKQSVSLKLRNLDERKFVLRLINKDPTKAIPTDIRNTFLHDIVEDQISAQHPYAALTIAPMADAICIYHTNPKLILIPNDSCLGPYREQFQNSLAFLEEDPDGNHEDVSSLGYATKIVGTDKMRSNLESDNDNHVDERNFLRVRMFDMLIGDWDRHERQYRWVIQKSHKGELYRAVPEDRDQAYFKFEGIIPFCTSRKWALRNLQDFEYNFKDIKGLNQSARLIDRRYLSSLSKEDWITIADSTKNSLTDKAIEEGIRQLPDSIFKLHGEELIAKLKSRRDNLTDAANKYYKILSKYVDVFGSDKNEKFVVERIDNHLTKVSIYKINKEGKTKNPYWSRTFNKNETKEIRLYGLSGQDYFEINGKANKGIKIRIIGGNNEDTLNDESKVIGLGKKTLYYDTKKENTIVKSNETNLQLLPSEIINYPSQDRFSYNYLGPRASIAYNADDGAFLGVGLIYRGYKFRGVPYGSQHSILLSKATNTKSARIEYNGEIKNFYKKINLGIYFDMYKPAYVMNFFGYGNESVKATNNIDFYRTSVRQTMFNPFINKDYTRFLKLGIGPTYQYFRLSNQPNTFLGESVTNPDFYNARNYLGVRAFLKLGTKDNELNPTRGIVLTGEANYNTRLDSQGHYSKYLSEFSFYISPNLPFQFTIATRIGVGLNYGDFEFYQANALGNTFGVGQTGNLRGFRKTRFIGDKSCYQNLELRLQLFKLNTYLFSSKFGVLGLLDNGRVWAANQDSHQWHTGYGGGLWTSLFNKFIFTATYAFSNEDREFNLRMGFLF